MKEETPKKNQKVNDSQEKKILSQKLPYIFCPYCKINKPKIVEIQKDLSENCVFISILCKCLKNPKTISLNDLFGILNKKNSQSFKCYKHKEKEGIEYCQNCKYFMCDVCKEYHRDFLSNHKTISSKLINNKIEYCDFHNNNKIEFYCKTCEKTICNECINEFHKNHEILNVKSNWEKIYQKIKISFNSIEKLESKLDNEKKNFENFVINSLEKITNLINKLEKLRGLIYEYYNLSIGNHRMVSSIIVASFSEFFQKKEDPNFFNIHNCENLIPLNLVSFEEFEELEKVFSGFSKLFNNLTTCESSILKRNLVNVKEINNGIKHLKVNIKYKTANLSPNSNINNLGTLENNSTLSDSKKELDLINNQNKNLLNKKIKFNKEIPNNNSQKKKQKNKNYVFKIPINKEAQKITENTINIMNNNKNIEINEEQKLNEKTNNNHIHKPINIHKQKDLFTFDDEICKKYLNSSSSNYFDSISNNLIIDEGYECIHLGRVEDNKLLKNKMKKLDENQVNGLNDTEKNDKNNNKNEQNFFNDIFYNNNTISNQEVNEI